jgi:hypothetical protein
MISPSAVPRGVRSFQCPPVTFMADSGPQVLR